MVKKFQNMNRFGTTTCGIIIDYENKNFQYYPVQAMDVCSGKRVSKKKIKELLNECIDEGFTELPINWGDKTFYGTGRNPEDIETKDFESDSLCNDSIDNKIKQACKQVKVSSVSGYTKDKGVSVKSKQ